MYKDTSNTNKDNKISENQNKLDFISTQTTKDTKEIFRKIALKSTIEVISRSCIRYKGTLVLSTDPIILENVSSFGTEDRKCTHFVPKGSNVYDKIVLKIGNIQSLKFDKEFVVFEDEEINLNLNSELSLKNNNFIRSDLNRIKNYNKKHEKDLSGLNNTFSSRETGNSIENTIYETSSSSNTHKKCLNDSSKPNSKINKYVIPNINKNFQPNETFMNLKNNKTKNEINNSENNNYNEKNKNLTSKPSIKLEPDDTFYTKNKTYKNYEIKDKNINSYDESPLNDTDYYSSKNKRKSNFGYIGNRPKENYLKPYGSKNEEFISNINDNVSNRMKTFYKQRNSDEDNRDLNENYHKETESFNYHDKKIQSLFYNQDMEEIEVPETEFDLNTEDGKEKRDKNELIEESKAYYDPEKDFFDDLRKK